MWMQYIEYLKKWIDEHSTDEFEGMSPVCYGEWCDNEMQDNADDEDEVTCVWCGEVFEKDECKYELGFNGWLCPRCRDALWSRGEKMRFKED